MRECAICNGLSCGTCLDRTEEDRAAFELCCNPEALERREDGSYIDPHICSAWNLWRRALEYARSQ